MSLATIEATDRGFDLHIVDKRLEYIAKLNRDLMVEAAYWVDSQQQIETDITPFSYQPVVYIKPDGSFYFEDRTGDSSISTFHGIVQFLQGAETIVFGDLPGIEFKPQFFASVEILPGNNQEISLERA